MMVLSIQSEEAIRQMLEDHIEDETYGEEEEPLGLEVA